MRETAHFVPGEAYVRRTVHDRFGGQRQGGISTPANVPAIFLFTGAEGQAFGYDDGWQEDASFRYFGEGQVGDMTLTRGNLAIKNHAEDGRDLHLFESIPDGRVRYVGQMICSEVEVLPNVPDRNGSPRTGLAFRLVPLARASGEDTLEQPAAGEQTPVPEDRLWKVPMNELRELALQPPDTTQGPSKGSRNVYRRSAAVKIYVQRRANGVCEGCQSPAPFRTPDRRPYLEPHHTRRLSDGGPDHPGWVLAICPTCHRRAHYAEDRRPFNEHLQQRANALEGSH